MGKEKKRIRTREEEESGCRAGIRGQRRGKRTRKAD